MGVAEAALGKDRLQQAARYYKVRPPRSLTGAYVVARMQISIEDETRRQVPFLFHL